MLASRRLHLAPEWDGRFTRMVLLSGVAHVSVLLLILTLAVRGGQRPLPMTAYTVELTDPNAVGGRLPPGPISTEPTPAPSAGPPARGEPEAPAAAAPEPAPVPAPEPEPEQVAKVEPAPPEPPAPEAVRIEPAKKPEPKAPPKAAKPEPKPPAEKPKPAEKKPAPKPEEKPKAAAEKPKPAAEQKPAEKVATGDKPTARGTPDAPADAPPRDAYSAAAERWRAKAEGRGLGGTDSGSGPLGTGGPGPGGGGQVVGIEFLAYRQTVITTIKNHWTNAIVTPGLVAAVRFEIAPDGTLGAIRLERSSGNAAYDASALRAVQRTQQLPPPPARYAKEFSQFIVEFHSEETAGRGAG